jgi:intracellular multiplication protein IcmB
MASAIIDPIIDIVESLMAWTATSILKQTFPAYCKIVTSDSDTSLVGSDGSLASVVRLDGTGLLIGTKEFDHLVESVTRSLQPFLSSLGHSVQVFFMRDPELVRREIEDSQRPSLETMRRHGLDIEELIEERTANMAKYCSSEQCYLVLWTKPSSMSSDELKRDRRAMQELIKSKNIPPMSQAQYLYTAIPTLRNRHTSFVDAVLADFKDFGLRVSLLEVHSAIHASKMTVSPSRTDLDWRPALPGDKIVPRVLKGIGPRDISEVMWPKLEEQIMGADCEVRSLRTVRIADRFYAPMVMEHYPQQPQAFDKLFRRLGESGIPYRVSFMIDPEGLNSLKFKATMATFLAFASDTNKKIKAAVEALRQIEHAGEAVVQMRIAFATWSQDEKLLESRASSLARAVQGWGICDVRDVTGDPALGLVSSMMGVSDESCAPAVAAPLSDVVSMLPITRPGSAWESGAQLFRTEDGKLLPYQPGSGKQDTWIDLIYSPPGGGKSVLMNASNMALCLSPGIERLPYIAIIDVGPSSSGLIELLKEALPADKKHLANYFRLSMSEEYAINPFDTQLGCRFPVGSERSTLVAILTLLATPVGKSEPYNSAADMAGLLVDTVYKLNVERPKRYERFLNEEIDSVLEREGFVQEHDSAWWDVVDFLFDKHLHHEASIAQRYAVPTLADITKATAEPEVKDIYGRVIVDTGETLVQAMNRVVSSSIREFPVLSQPTRFDIGDSRIVSIDLDEVARGDGEGAARQTSLMYMLARHASARHFYLLPTVVSTMPERYRDYHAKRISEIREDVKRLCYDEFHRTSAAKVVREQVLRDMREGRKWNIQVTLVSQSIEDFDEVMIEFATSIFVLKVPNPEAAARTAKILKLSEAARIALERKVRGPKKGGGTILAWFATKDGTTLQLLTNTVGPIELWAYSTTVEDVAIRRRLYSIMHPPLARRKLARAYPGGSAKDDVDRRKAMMRDENAGSVIDEIVREIAAMPV